MPMVIRTVFVCEGVFPCHKGASFSSKRDRGDPLIGVVMGRSGDCSVKACTERLLLDDDSDSSRVPIVATTTSDRAQEQDEQTDAVLERALLLLLHS